VFQQAASGLSVVPPEAFEATNGWATFAIEYKPSNTGEGYVYWLQQNKATWKLTDVALRAESVPLIHAKEATDASAVRGQKYLRDLSRTSRCVGQLRAFEQTC
jgi:hypothetical protein